MKGCSKVFTEEGFSYWNDGQRKLAKHAASDLHLQCVKLLYHGDKSQPKIDVSLDASITTSREQNRSMLSHSVQALKFLSR